VIANLLHNAAKYTDPRGHLRLEARREGEEAVVRVRDDGRGIAPAAQARLFELFYQVDPTLDRADGGLGVGLALVKRLVEMHGGRVEVHSAGRGAGSEFVVRLPALPAPAVARPPAPPAPKAAPAAAGSGARRLRVLVVDDNRDSAETMADLLRLEGHEALVAHDGREAVALALSARPDVVLLDIGLPGMDGHAACRAMRAGGLAARIVAMTGYGQAEDQRRSREAGFDAHLVKPVAPEALHALLAG
jgi:CheY-like chemotaxis protein